MTKINNKTMKAMGIRLFSFSSLFEKKTSRMLSWGKTLTFDQTVFSDKEHMRVFNIQILTKIIFTTFVFFLLRWLHADLHTTDIQPKDVFWGPIIQKLNFFMEADNTDLKNSNVCVQSNISPLMRVTQFSN